MWVAVGGEHDAAEAAAVEPVPVRGVDVRGEEVEPGLPAVHYGEWGRGDVEGEVPGGDKVVAEENDAAERGVREGLGLGEAAEDALGEVPVGAHEPRDEPLGAEDRLRRVSVVGDEGVQVVGLGAPGA